MDSSIEIPVSLSAYEASEAEQNLSLLQTLAHRAQLSPFNLVATLIFVAAIIHTFFAAKILKVAHKIQVAYNERPGCSEGTCFLAEILHFCGEVEVVFGLWCIPLLLAMRHSFGYGGVTYFFNNVADYTEPIFVVIIMAIASTKPILALAESILMWLAKIGGCTPGTWWLTTLIIAPLMGSFITEPAAMTIAAMLLAKQFYRLNPSNKLKYATLGLLFVSVSIGGTLTHFAAPPILMVAHKWSLTLGEVFFRLGSHAVLGIVINTLTYYLIFRREFKSLSLKEQDLSPLENDHIPIAITIVHVFFLFWAVYNSHTPSLLVAGFLFFLGFIKATRKYQTELNIKNPLLVGFFLAGLVTHGSFQSWWLSPILSSLSETSLFIGSTILTAFNDNAAITYLASLVPMFLTNKALQKAILAGAVTGGGLTVIANAPNPAGQNILSKYFPSGISPVKLLLGAAIPTIIAALCFML